MGGGHGGGNPTTTATQVGSEEHQEHRMLLLLTLQTYSAQTSKKHPCPTVSPADRFHVLVSF